MVRYEDKFFVFDNPQPINWKYPIKIVLSKLLDPFYKLVMDLSGRKATYDKKYRVSICAIFRDEAPYLREWIEFHKIVGVDHFYLYNNFSADDYQEVLRPYIENGDVTLTEWPYLQGQMSAYRDCIERYREETQWIGFIDIDEFVVPKKMDTIYEFLKPFSRRAAVLIYWKFFGSSGFLERNIDRLVTEDFTVSWPKYTDIGKCFYNTGFAFAAAASKNKVMHHLCYCAVNGVILPPVNLFDRCVLFGRHWAMHEDFPIQINHYYTKSWKEYQVKKQRKSVYHKYNTHTNDAFFEHEMKCWDTDHSAYKYLIKLKIKMGKE